MCGRKFATEELTWADYREHLSIIAPSSNLEPSYNIAPTQLYIICLEQHGKRIIRPMRWWLVPPWVKELSSKYPSFNARSETLEEKASFKNLLRGNRCVSMVSGFYEWQPKSKQPFAIKRADKKPMILAGLWCDNSYLEMSSYTIATTQAPDSFKHIHHRCPVILEPSQVGTWLSAPWKEARGLTKPFEGDLAPMAVSKDVGAVRNNYPALLDPISAD